MYIRKHNEPHEKEPTRKRAPSYQQTIKQSHGRARIEISKENSEKEKSREDDS